MRSTRRSGPSSFSPHLLQVEAPDALALRVGGGELGELPEGLGGLEASLAELDEDLAARVVAVVEGEGVAGGAGALAVDVDGRAFGERVDLDGRVGRGAGGGDQESQGGGAARQASGCHQLPPRFSRSARSVARAALITLTLFCSSFKAVRTASLSGAFCRQKKSFLGDSSVIG